jgi:glycosyltransferase involved in cell wall biosynthesis
MQTETSRRGLHRRARIPLEMCYVVSNTCGDHYRAASEIRPFPQAKQTIRFLVFTAPYKHKNLGIVPRVAAELKDLNPRLNFEFVLTLPSEGPVWKQLQSAAARLNVADRLTNVGPVAVADGPALYRSCHVCFLPTVLETFSATYVESMAMGLPIVTSDLDFARDTCGDAALYFHPRRPREAAQQLLQLLESRESWQRLTDEGRRVLARLPTAHERFTLFCEVFQRVLATSAQKPPR